MTRHERFVATVYKAIEMNVHGHNQLVAALQVEWEPWINYSYILEEIDKLWRQRSSLYSQLDTLVCSK